MTSFLRLLGILNAAVWFGAALFFTFAVGPVFFQPVTKKVLGEAQAGIVAMMVLERYFLLHITCALVGILHQLAEWVYLGRFLHRATLVLLGCLTLFGLLSEFWIQPKMQRLHEIKYAYLKSPQGYVRNESVTPEQRAQAGKTFGLWHGASQISNLIALGGVALVLWRVIHTEDPTRFLSARQFRG